MDNIKEREELLVKLGFLKPKVKKVQQKRKLKKRADPIIPIRRSARLSKL